MTPEYIRRLSRKERLGCIKLGMARGFSRNGISLSGRGDTEKTAIVGELENLGDLGWKMILGVSVIGGVPLGVAAHIVDNKINEENLKETELLHKARYYRDASGSLEESLPPMPEQQEQE